MTQTYIKTTLKKWLKNHPDCDWSTFWFVQNAVGTLIKWPKWYSEWVKDMGYSQKRLK